MYLSFGSKFILLTTLHIIRTTWSLLKGNYVLMFFLISSQHLWFKTVSLWLVFWLDVEPCISELQYTCWWLAIIQINHWFNLICWVQYFCFYCVLWTCLFPTAAEISNGILLKEIIFAFQGIEGKYIKYDAGRDAFFVDSKVCYT